MLYRSRIKSVLACAVLVLAVASTGYADTIIRFQTVMGDFNVQLYDSAAPGTVANFLRYAESGRFTDSFFHRLPTGFVLQGGGFTYDGFNGTFASVDTYEPIVNEYSPTRSNLRGTLAMAKVAAQYDENDNVIAGTGPDSATSEFFINLGDNSGNLDSQNGGFTVFGEVMGNGMDVVDELAAVPTFTFDVLGSPLDDMPLIDYSPGDSVGVDNLEMFSVLASLPGDVDGDSWVDGSDLVPLMVNWGQTGTLLADGELTGDGFVGGDDLEAILNNWDWDRAWMLLDDGEYNPTEPSPINNYVEEPINSPSFAAAPMPEPGTLILVALGGLAVIIKRKASSGG